MRTCSRFKEKTIHFGDLADPGWAYGLYYGSQNRSAWGIASLWMSVHLASIMQLKSLKSIASSNLTGSPTAFRMFFGFKRKV